MEDEDEDEDRGRLLALLGKVAEDFNWRCYAFVLMGNHYHLRAETPETTLSRGMRQLNAVCTLGFNRRHGRVGYLFQAAAPGVRGRRDGETLQREDRVFARKAEAVRKRLRSSPSKITE